MKPTIIPKTDSFSSYVIDLRHHDSVVKPVGLCMTENGNVIHFLEIIEGDDWKCKRCGKVIERKPPNR